jgi:hypothetical protein
MLERRAWDRHRESSKKARSSEMLTVIGRHSYTVIDQAGAEYKRRVRRIHLA